MNRLGKDVDELARYHAALRAPTRVERTRLLVMDLEHTVDQDVEVQLLDGQVSVNVDVGSGGEGAEETTVRTLQMTVADPTSSLGLDATSTATYSAYPQSMVQVVHGLWVPGDGWADCPVHTGPLVNVVPGDTGVVEIDAQGKEALAAGVQRQRAWKPKTKKTDIIGELLRMTGERAAYMVIPDLAAQTSKRFVLLETDNPWRKAKALAKSMGYVLYYDGRGVAMMRRQPSSSVFTYSTGMVLGDVIPDITTGQIYNRFEVVGGKPKGSKKRVTSGTPLIELDDDHPWSAKNLGRNGVPRVLTQRESNDQFVRRVDCRYRALQMRDTALRASIETAAEVVSNPTMEEYDPVLVRAASGGRVLRLRQFTIPLAGQAQTLGTVRRTGGAFVPAKPKPPKKRRPGKKAAGKKAAAKRPGRRPPGRAGIGGAG